MAHLNKIGLEKQLSDLLIWLSSSLKSGLSLPQAFQMASQEMAPPLGEELKGMVSRVEQGMTLEESLLVMERAMRLKDFSLLVHSIVLLREVGGNFVAHFENLAKILRQRHQVSNKVRLMVAQGLMQGNLLAFMPLILGLGLYFLSPEFFAPFFEHPQGPILLVFVFLLDLGGWLWMRKLAKVKV